MQIWPPEAAGQPSYLKNENKLEFINKNREISSRFFYLYLPVVLKSGILKP